MRSFYFLDMCGVCVGCVWGCVWGVCGRGVFVYERVCVSVCVCARVRLVKLEWYIMKVI